MTLKKKGGFLICLKRINNFITHNGKMPNYSNDYNFTLKN